MKRTRNPEGFYSKNWNDEQQEEDEWKVPDKFQRISQMVFHNGFLERHPVTVFNTKGADVAYPYHALDNI